MCMSDAWLQTVETFVGKPIRSREQEQPREHCLWCRRETTQCPSLEDDLGRYYGIIYTIKKQ